jgi:hypothetical protein
LGNRRGRRRGPRCTTRNLIGEKDERRNHKHAPCH